MRFRSAVPAAAASALLVAASLSTTALTVAAPSAAATPTVIGQRVIGHSVQGRAIVAYHLGNPKSRITGVVLGQMHGDEHAGRVAARAIVRGRPVTGIDLWVVTTLNPDGDAAHTRKNRHGVDLNRNWPTRWTRLSGMYDSGPKPLSEPETRAMHRFLKQVKPRYLVSLHQPLKGVDTTDGGKRDPAFRKRLAHNLNLPSKPFECWSGCHGSMTRWVTKHQTGAAITVEFGSKPSSYAVGTRAPKGIVRAMRGGFR